MERLLVSACLLGCDCKYSGGNNALDDKTLKALRSRYTLVPVCPEVAGGLPVPRAPSEIRGGRVVSKAGNDVTAQYEKGAMIALRLARLYGCKHALLKERSPSCGSGRVYDGEFSGTLTEGDGVTAAALKAAGVTVTGESEVDKLV